jgi:hypothetical protein
MSQKAAGPFTCPFGSTWSPGQCHHTTSLMTAECTDQQDRTRMCPRVEAGFRPTNRRIFPTLSVQKDSDSGSGEKKIIESSTGRTPSATDLPVRFLPRALIKTSQSRGGRHRAKEDRRYLAHDQLFARRTVGCPDGGGSRGSSIALRPEPGFSNVRGRY